VSAPYTIVASFFGDQGYLISFDSLIYFTTFEKICLKIGSGGWLYLGKVLAP